MSTYRLVKSKSYWMLYKGNHVIDTPNNEDLSELASACQAALCEQNSGAMSGQQEAKPDQCSKCGFGGLGIACEKAWRHVKSTGGACVGCLHGKVCHQAPGGEA